MNLTQHNLDFFHEYLSGVLLVQMEILIFLFLFHILDISWFYLLALLWPDFSFLMRRKAMLMVLLWSSNAPFPLDQIFQLSGAHLG